VKNHRLYLELSKLEARTLYKAMLAGLQSGALNNRQNNMVMIISMRLKNLDDL
jgi:hypothetical protein